MKTSSRLKQRARGILPYVLEEVEGEKGITSYAGLPLVAEAFRATGAAEAVRKYVKTRERIRERGLTDVEMVESICLLLAAGGDCIDDFRFMGSDVVLKEMIGHELPSPTRVKDFLYKFHDDEKEKLDLRQRELIPSFVPEESGPLAGLGEALRATAWAMQKHSPISQATIDLDATIIESEKEEAKMTYEGRRGYQPVVALWVEKDQILADEFRDGNVPAGCGLLRVLKRAIERLPDGIERVFLRSDSAAYTHELLNWCREAKDEHPPMVFAISADMSEELREAIKSLPDDAWHELEESPGYIRHWAEVEFIPSSASVKKGRAPDRYLAIRAIPKQGVLFSGCGEERYFAIVTNDWERDGKELIEWHRGKAGTIEKLHDVLKNDLGGGVLPCGRFGANAGWFRLNVLTYNLLSVLRQTALPGELEKARPKRIRFRVLCVAGEVLHHAREVVVRVVGEVIGGEGLLARARKILLRLREKLQRYLVSVFAPA